MDPFTLFALANGAVSAVKAGCKLYKDIKGAAGEVTEVLKDLDSQFEKLHPPEKPATVEQRNNFIKQKNEVITLNKKANAGEHTGIYTEIGNHLGAYYDNYYRCMAIFEEEEKRAKTQAYHGEDSLGKRALQRVLMRKQLEQMGTELREIMVYQSPPELGALHTEVEEMMEVMGKQQKILIAKEMRQQQVEEKRRQAKIRKMKDQAMFGVVVLIVILATCILLVLVAHDRAKKYPQYGTGLFPKSEAKRRAESEPHVYIGR